jgi:hypothetical protein
VVEEISTMPVVLFEDKFAQRTSNSVSKQANLIKFSHTNSALSHTTMY